MAFINAVINSDSIGMQTNVRVIMPQSKYNERKLLYLLHGIFDDSSGWTRKTRVELYAEEHNYVVVMPEVHKSFYMDMEYGGQYFTYVSDELPKLMENLFGIEHEREKTFIAGLSMGGYGALKCGLSKPEFYKGCASFSGAVDVQKLFDETPWYKEKYAVYGDKVVLKDSDDLFKLAVNAGSSETENKLKVFVCCGTEDFLLGHNRSFNELMNKLNFDYKYMEWAGTHDFYFWDTAVKYAFEFFDGEPGTKNE